MASAHAKITSRFFSVRQREKERRKSDTSLIRPQAGRSSFAGAKFFQVGVFQLSEMRRPRSSLSWHPGSAAPPPPPTAANFLTALSSERVIQYLILVSITGSFLLTHPPPPLQPLLFSFFGSSPLIFLPSKFICYFLGKIASQSHWWKGYPTRTLFWIFVTFIFWKKQFFSFFSPQNSFQSSKCKERKLFLKSTHVRW